MVMKCDICGENDAVIFVQQVMGAKSVDLNLCTDCARKRGIQTAGGKIEFSVSGLLNGLFDQKAAKNVDLQPCPQCGMSLDEIQKNGRLGCFRCAGHFQREIMLILRKHSSQSQHKGKYPKRLLSDTSIMADRELLKDMLKRAVADEDYESAAEMRDRLKTLDGISGGMQ
jgi:protein arginine kinase activator